MRFLFILGVPIVLYLTMAFIYLEPNVLLWDIDQRTFFIVLSFLLSSALFFVFKIKDIK